MSRSLWKGALLGGLTLFVWSFISWTVLPWHDATFNAFTDEDEVARVVGANTAGRGIYLYPGAHHEPGMTREEREAAEAAAWEKMAAGPVLFVSVQEGGMTSMAGPLLVAFVYLVLAALVLTMIVSRCRETGYWERVSLVVLAVIAGGILCHLPAWNWWGFSHGYTVVAILDLLVAGLLAGLVIAKVTPSAS